MNNIIFRPIERNDLYKVFSLLQQLTKIDYSDRDEDECWDKFISNNSSNSIIGIYDNEIVAYGSIVIENKIRGEVAGHVEDIVVDNKARGKNIGVDLIKELVKIAKDKKCYRVTLLCDEDLSNFYTKNGFMRNGIAMKVYPNK
tara:strand:+ start:1701 stop:2129 length:429 start_codon:yes stop_codon:yes gene_type:complete